MPFPPSGVLATSRSIRSRRRAADGVSSYAHGRSAAFRPPGARPVQLGSGPCWTGQTLHVRCGRARKCGLRDRRPRARARLVGTVTGSEHPTHSPMLGMCRSSRKPIWKDCGAPAASSRSRWLRRGAPSSPASRPPSSTPSRPRFSSATVRVRRHSSCTASPARSASASATRSCTASRARGAWREGDVVTLDVTAELDGYMADAAVTVIVPPVAPLAERLVQTAGRRARARHRRGARGPAAERRRPRGRAHGRARRLHRPAPARGPRHRAHDPRGAERPELRRATPPSAADAGSRDSRSSRSSAPRGEALSEDADGWTVRTRDGSLTAHAEHTVVVTRRGAPIVLTSTS